MTQVLHPPEQATGRQGGTPRRLASWREDLITALLGGWMTVGVALDAWAHVNGKPDSFFTPWHGVFYSGALALILWIAGRSLTRRAGGRRELRAPAGYGPALAAAAIFPAGGAGDGVWHTVFGIEVSLEAVLSPSHLTLFFSSLVLLATPLLAAWRSPRTGSAPTLRGLLPAVLSLTFTVLLAGIFIGHASAFSEPAAVLPARAAAPPGTPDHYVVSGGFMDIMFTTFLLLAPLLLALRRWRLPFGTATIVFTTVAVVTLLIHGAELPGMALAALAGGLTADRLMTHPRWARDPSRAHLLVATVTPLALWAAYFLALHLEQGLTWPVEVWGGAILFAVAGGLLLHLLMVPPRLPREAGEVTIEPGHLTAWPR